MEQSLKYLYSRIKKPELTKQQAESRVCQEIFILKIGSSPTLSKRVAFKGGLIIDSLARGNRGYTKDIDFDFIKYPLSNDGLNSFIDDLNNIKIFSNIKISISKIEELRHKHYQGKRITLLFNDMINEFTLMVDVGIYLPLIKKNISYDYQVAFGNHTKIMVNSIERMVAEKLSTFAIYGTDNTRSKDLFDAYYLISRYDFDNLIVKKILNKILVSETHYFKKIEYGLNEIIACLQDKKFVVELKKSDRNWLNQSTENVISKIIDFVNNLK